MLRGEDSAAKRCRRRSYPHQVRRVVWLLVCWLGCGHADAPPPERAEAVSDPQPPQEPVREQVEPVADDTSVPEPESEPEPEPEPPLSEAARALAAAPTWAMGEDMNPRHVLFTTAGDGRVRVALCMGVNLDDCLVDTPFSEVTFEGRIVRFPHGNAQIELEVSEDGQTLSVRDFPTYWASPRQPTPTHFRHMDVFEEAYIQSVDMLQSSSFEDVNYEHLRERHRAYRRGVLAADVDPAVLSTTDVEAFEESVVIDDEHIHCRRVRSRRCRRDLDAVAAEVERQMRARDES